MTPASRTAIDKQLESMPPLPVTVTRVLEVTSDPRSSANALMKAILPDQAICITILKFANSVLYGRPKKVASVETAIVVLGFDEIRNIVLGKTAVTTMKSSLKEQWDKLDRFWTHSFTCGLAARNIAEHLCLKSGQFFMAGLLHDFGKLALLLAFPDNFDPTKRFAAISTSQSLTDERTQFSVSHSEVGARLLQHWQFPDTLVASLRWHHSPKRAEPLSKHAIIIQLADFLAHCCALSELPDERTLSHLLNKHIPGFLDQWHNSQLPWEETTLEYLFNWVKVDQSHGSAILDILAA